MEKLKISHYEWRSYLTKLVDVIHRKINPQECRSKLFEEEVNTYEKNLNYCRERFQVNEKELSALLSLKIIIEKMNKTIKMNFSLKEFEKKTITFLQWPQTIEILAVAGVIFHAGRALKIFDVDS